MEVMTSGVCREPSIRRLALGTVQMQLKHATSFTRFTSLATGNALDLLLNPISIESICDICH